MLYMIGFTKHGMELAQKIKINLNYTAKLYYKSGQDIEFGEKISGTLEEWTGDAFLNADVILFIGACGIAVRSIAPFLTDKWHDPAVLVIDEGGRHCISLLSGHVGGGNLWCERIADIAGAVPVITTATDVNGKFAVDVFAGENKMYLKEPELAKEVSAAVLAGKKIPLVVEDGIFCREAECEIEDEIKTRLDNAGILLFAERQLESAGYWPGMEAGFEIGIYVGVRRVELPFEKALHLIPKALVLGVGCKKGTSEEVIGRRVDEFCRDRGLFQEAFSMVSTIDLKKEEPGLLAFCDSRELPLVTFSTEKLRRLEGDFTPSPFVEQTTGVDNVCERSALALALEQGQGAGLLERKYSGEGVTAAAAVIQKGGPRWDGFM